jgi:hypothetical protein
MFSFHIFKERCISEETYDTLGTSLRWGKLEDGKDDRLYFDGCSFSFGLRHGLVYEART